jgi:hypothetical protein
MNERSCVSCRFNGDEFRCPLFDAYRALFKKYNSIIYNNAFNEAIREKGVVCNIYEEKR